VNRADVADLPVVVDVPTAAAVLGVSQRVAYRLIKTGGWPTPVLRLGRLIKIPTSALRALLVLDDANAARAQAGAGDGVAP
jgi:excisionase family DNA binding protein